MMFRGSRVVRVGFRGILGSRQERLRVVYGRHPSSSRQIL